LIKKNRNLQLKKGIAWSSIGQIGTQIVSFGFGIILARILLPTEFGILAMVTVFTGFAEVFKDLGFGAAIIQKKEISEDDLSTSFWLNISVGIVLFSIFYISSGYIANFYENDIIGDITRVVAINFIISSIAVVHQSLVLKNLNFKFRAKLNISAILISSIVGIIIALYGYGVWSLVYMTLIKNLFLTFSYWILIKWKPKFVFCKKSLNSLFKFGSIVTANSFLGYLNRNADNLIIGKILGDNSLGIYTRVYSIMLLPIRNISNGFKTALFPSLSKIQDNKAEIKRLYLKSTKLVAYVTFPLMFGLSSVSKQFVPILYGNNWLEMIPILQVLSIFGAFQSLMTFNGTIFYSLGKPKYELIIFLVTTPIIILSFYIGIRINGLLGLVYCYTLTSILLMGYKLHYVKKLIEIKYLEFISNIFYPLLFSSIMYVSIYLLQKYVINFFSPFWIQIVVLSIVGCLLYSSFIYLFAKPFLFETIRSIRIKKAHNVN